MAISDCTDASEVMVAQPCVGCLSELERWALLAVLIGGGQGMITEDLVEGAKKYGNLSDMDFLQGLISTLPDSWLANVDFSAIDDSIKDVRNRGEQNIKGMILFAWCSYFKTV
jgi:hypothetical protein